MSVDIETRPRRRWLALLPLAIFAALAAVFFLQLVSGRDAAVVPSALIGAQAPETVLPPLEGLDRPGFDTMQLEGKVTLVNVFASWCAPCRVEHPLLMALAQDKRIQIAGLNYKDEAENARRFLGELGNPYGMVGVDPRGRAAIDWGVYGVPETFVVGKDGSILYKHVGPLTPEAIAARIVPAVEDALARP